MAARFSSWTPRDEWWFHRCKWFQCWFQSISPVVEWTAVSVMSVQTHSRQCGRPDESSDIAHRSSCRAYSRWTLKWKSWISHGSSHIYLGEKSKPTFSINLNSEWSWFTLGSRLLSYHLCITSDLTCPLLSGIASLRWPPLKVWLQQALRFQNMSFTWPDTLHNFQTSIPRFLSSY